MIQVKKIVSLPYKECKMKALPIISILAIVTGALLLNESDSIVGAILLIGGMIGVFISIVKYRK